MQTIDTLAELESLYGAPAKAAVIKQRDHVTPLYRRWLEASPFLALATAGLDGLDCSPRGEKGGLVRLVDPKTLHLPDRRGNNRVDSLRNIVRDPRVALLFLIPGLRSCLRVNGRARLLVEPDLLASFAMDGAAPRCVIEIAVEAVYSQCGRAIMRADLWNGAGHVDPATLPSVGDLLKEAEQTFDGADYDARWEARARTTLW